jgi:putative chitinase
MQIKKGQLVQLGCSPANELKYIDYLNAACAKYNINTTLRLSAFFANVYVESANLSVITENLNYSSARLMVVFPSHFASPQDASSYGGNPVAIANRVYSNRMGNGSEASSDGYKFRGRSFMQITGKSNYNSCSQGIGVDFIGNPDLLVSPQYAALSAGWFWNSKSLNDYADRSDFINCCKRINGGTNGLSERTALYQKALIIFGDGNTQPVSPPTNPPTTTPVPTNTDPITTKKPLPQPALVSPSGLGAILSILGIKLKRVALAISLR